MAHTIEEFVNLLNGLWSAPFGGPPEPFNKFTNSLMERFPTGSNDFPKGKAHLRWFGRPPKGGRPQAVLHP